jgi:protein-S-isoprenylcysteine O-methyltransferase Ste14
MSRYKMNGLIKRAVGGLLFLFIVLAVVLFGAAWSFDYWEAWVFLAVFFLPVLVITLYLIKRDPSLLERRIKAGPVAEKEAKQKIIQSIAALAFILIFILSAVDHRGRWSAIPVMLDVAGDILIVCGLGVVFFVFRENSFASATIEVGVGQTLVSTGLYGVVRHPMYFGAFVMLLGTPVALGSWWGLPAVVPIFVVIVWRLLDEEVFLERNLPGYGEYRDKVKYRLLPFIW